MSQPSRFDARQAFYRLGAHLILRWSEQPGGSSGATALRATVKELLADAPQVPRRAYHRHLYAVVHVADKLAAMDVDLKPGQPSKVQLLVPVKLDGKHPLDRAFTLCARALTAPPPSLPGRRDVKTVASRVRAALVKIRKATAHLPRARGFSAAHRAMRGTPDPLSQMDAAVEIIERSVTRFLEAPRWEAELPSQVMELLNAAQLEWFEIAVITEQGTSPDTSAVERRRASNRARDWLEPDRHWLRKATVAGPRAAKPKAPPGRRSRK